MSIKVIVIGRYQCGKTCMVNRILTDRFNSEKFTCSIIVSTYKLQGKEFQFNDISGKETFQNVVKPLFRNAKIAIIVFSINSDESFQEIDKWHDKVKEVLNVDDPNDPNFVSIILVGSKSDLEPTRKVTPDQAYQKACSLGNLVKYIEISSKNGENIDSLKEEIVNCANRITIVRSNSPVHNNQTDDNSGCCK